MLWKRLLNFKTILIHFWDQNFLGFLCHPAIFVAGWLHNLFEYHSASTDCTILKKLKWLCKAWNSSNDSCPRTRNYPLLRIWIWFWWFNHSTSVSIRILINSDCSFLIWLLLWWRYHRRLMLSGWWRLVNRSIIHFFRLV